MPKMRVIIEVEAHESMMSEITAIVDAALSFIDDPIVDCEIVDSMQLPEDIDATAIVETQDMSGNDCLRQPCEGYYKETSIHDDLYGDLHCSVCGHRVDHHMEID